MAKPRSKPQLSLQSSHLWDDLGGIPENHWCYAFYTHIRCAFSDEMFADMYQEGGRAPISPGLLACITILQGMLPVGSRRAVEWTIVRRDWRIALGIPVGWEGFDHTVLWRFQERLEAHEGCALIFGRVLEQARKLGLLAGTRALRVDATHLLAAASALSRAEAIQEALRVVVCEAARVAPGLLDDGRFETLHEAYHAESWIGCDRGGQRTLRELGRDGYALVELCGGLELKHLATLEQMLAENFVIEPGAPPEPRDDRELSSDRIQTPHEPDVRCGRKGKRVWLGDKVHIVETCDEDESTPNLIVGVVTTDPRAEDSTVLPEILELAEELMPEGGMVLADGGYASASNSAQAEERGLDLVAPPRQDTSGMEVPAAEFEIDFEQEIATCPQGRRSVVWHRHKKRKAVNIRFDAGTCRACPLWGSCTSSKQGRTICVSSNYPTLVRERERAKTAEFKTTYKRRAGIEGTISRLVQCRGLRRSRGKGAPRRARHAILAATAHNAWQILTCLTGG